MRRCTHSFDWNGGLEAPFPSLILKKKIFQLVPFISEEGDLKRML